MSTITEDGTTIDNAIQVVSFIIAEEEFGIDILNVQEIIRPVEITRIPNTVPYVEGVINLRGRIVPVVDLRTRFGLGRREIDKNTRIVVVELDDKVVGFQMDAVSQVIRVEQEVIEPPPLLSTSRSVQYIRGVAKLKDRLITLLSLEELISDNALLSISLNEEK